MDIVQVDKETTKQHERNDEDWHQSHSSFELGNEGSVEKAIRSSAEVDTIDHCHEFEAFFSIGKTEIGCPVDDDGSNCRIDKLKGEVNPSSCEEVSKRLVTFAEAFSQENWSFVGKSRKGSLDSTKSIRCDQEEDDSSNVLQFFRMVHKVDFSNLHR